MENERLGAHHPAKVYRALGETDRALDYLEQAYEEREPVMIFLNVDPKWDVVRAHPRFEAIVEGIGLVKPR